jgi:8-amino-7-oxononanoate synthase
VTLGHLRAELDALRASGRLRRPVSEPPGLINLCSNDYLGYGAEPLGVLDGEGGTGASRLVSGTRAAHEQAEEALAAWVGLPAALLFSSGYAANLGVLTALAGPGDAIVSDALNHASIIDGCRLSGAAVLVAPHRDLEAVARLLRGAREARRRWVVTESYFSMDGDFADLGALRAACDEEGASLVVDEAHALGIFGPRGAGRCAAAGVVPEVLVGGLGKAIGLQGGFVAGSEDLRLWLWNRARSFVFSTGSSPALAGVLAGRVARAAADEAGRARVLDIARRLRGALVELGATIPAASHGPIIPWLIGGEAEAEDLEARARSSGILVRAIRPPTVPTGTSRIRLTASARLDGPTLQRALDALREVAGSLPVVSRETTGER